MTEDTSKRESARAKQIAYRLFRYRPRSEYEIIEKLKSKDLSEGTIKETVAYLRRIQLLDDRLFARGWISSRLRKPVGLYRIRQELKQKGIDDSIIQEECARAIDSYDEINTLKTLCQRRWKQYKHLPKLKARQRLYAYLMRRGFSADAVYKMIKDI